MLKDLNNARYRQKPINDERIDISNEFIVEEEIGNSKGSDKNTKNKSSYDNDTTLNANAKGSSQNDFDEEIIYEKYTVYWHNKKDDKLHNIIIELPQTVTVLEAIEGIIPIFNTKLNQEGSISFEINPNLFKLYPAKKNGMPKSDYPALDVEQILSLTSLQSLALVEQESKNSKQNKNGSSVASEKMGGSIKQQTDQSYANNISAKSNNSMIEPEMISFNKYGDGELNNNTINSNNEQDNMENGCCCWKKKPKKSLKFSLNTTTASTSTQPDLEKPLIKQLYTKNQTLYDYFTL